MAELGLLINILAKVDKALTEIDKIKTNMKKMGEEGTKQTDRSTLSAKRMGASLAMVAMLAKKAFRAIVNASPGVQVAFILMGVQMENMWRSIGENLAPAIEDNLSPAVQSLSEYIQDLEPEYQTWIGATIGLTVFLGFLAVAVAALSFVSLPLIGALVLIAATIGFVILASEGYLDGLAEKSEGWADAIRIATGVVDVLSFILGALWIFIKAGVGGIWEALKGLWEGLGFLADAFVDMFEGLVTFFKGIGTMLKGVFTLDWDLFIEGLKMVGIGIANFFIGVANLVIGLVQTLALTVLGLLLGIVDAVGGDITKLETAMTSVKGWGIETIKYHEGGSVGGPRDVMAWLKPKERVRTETQESALQRELARGGGGRSQKMVVNINITNPSFNERSDIDRMATIIERRLTQAQNQRVFS